MPVRDSNGTELKEGDSVIVIKDLKVKGSSTGLKRGTMVKNIHLTGNDDEISLLSPLGVALLGLRAGERMPFFTQDRGFRLLTVVEASPAEPAQPQPGARASPKSVSQAVPMEALS